MIHLDQNLNIGFQFRDHPVFKKAGPIIYLCRASVASDRRTDRQNLPFIYIYIYIYIDDHEVFTQGMVWAWYGLYSITLPYII